MVETPPAATAVNICKAPEMIINYMYMEMGRQMMILDIGTPVSVAGIAWMTQYLKVWKNHWGDEVGEMFTAICLLSQ